MGVALQDVVELKTLILIIFWIFKTICCVWSGRCFVLIGLYQADVTWMRLLMQRWFLYHDLGTATVGSCTGASAENR